jgi:hypothetical protein
MKSKTDPHKLTFEGKGPSTMGRCACGIVILQGLMSGTPRQQIRAQHIKHLASVAWMESIPK